MEVNYRQKYLKYKEKYLKLKAQLGGDYGRLYCTFVDKKDPNNYKPCTCIEYKGAYDYATIKKKLADGTEISNPLLSTCVNCDHRFENHINIHSNDIEHHITPGALKDRIDIEINNIKSEPRKTELGNLYTKYVGEISRMKRDLQPQTITPTTMSAIKTSFNVSNPNYILKDEYLSDDKKSKLILMRELQELQQSFSKDPKKQGENNTRIQEITNILYPKTGGGLGKCTKCNNNCDAFVSNAYKNVTGPGFTDTQRNEVYTSLVSTDPNCFRQNCKHKFSEHN